MKKIERRGVLCLLLALFLSLGTIFFVFRFISSGGKWASSAFNRHLYDSSGNLISGSVLDRDGDVLSGVDGGKRTYYDNPSVRQATLHAVGDLQGNIGTGALNAFADRLTGYNLLNGAFGAEVGKKLYLTIDARYNYEAWQALDGRKGTVAVYNYETGEILCMVSSPTFDPLNVPENMEEQEAYDGVYLNRFLSSSFTPGSIFKTVTLTAALEKLPDAENRTWTCGGSVELNGQNITCSGTHGEENLKEAFANSCNVVFAQIAAELGPETMEEYTKKAGLEKSYSVDGLPSLQGTFRFDQDPAQLGWAGVGQSDDLVNPCSFMVWMGAIANGGKAAQPYLILKTESALGLPCLPHMTRWSGDLISSDTAKKLREYMANNVAEVYGADRFPNMKLCAKSGTAEVGSEALPHAWFAGYLLNEDAPYAFVVLVENGGGGSTVAGAVAARVLNVMVNGY